MFSSELSVLHAILLETDMGTHRRLKKQGMIILSTAAAALVLACALILSSLVSSCTEPESPAETPSSLPEMTPEAADTPEPASYEASESPITLEDKFIYGKTYIPRDGRETHPVVILCHGIGVNHHHTENFAMMFAGRGIASYVFDFCGGGEPSQSSGSMQEMSVHTELEDLNDVIDHIKTIGIAGNNPITVLGMSQGGYVAAEAAARRPEEIAGLILFFPAFNINDLISAHFSSPEEVPEYVTIFDQTVSRQYFLDAMSEPIIEDMESYDKPVLILHGSEDDAVPYSYSENAAEHFPNAEFYLIDGAGHGFFLQDAETAFEYCMEFLSKYILG